MGRCSLIRALDVNLKSGEFKVPTKGVYEFSFSAGSCYQPTDIGIQKNGVTELQLTNRGTGSTNQHIPISSNWIMNLDKDDKIQLTELPHKRQKLSEMLKSPILTTFGWFDQPMGRVDQPK